MVLISNFNLSGFFRFDRDNVNAYVTRTSAGVYLLAQHSHGDVFNVLRAGRSDVNVNGRLLSYLNPSSPDHRSSYAWFAFVYVGGKRAAYELECRLFHQFAPTYNELHPDTPANMNLSCPICECCVRR
jgi:hypothetical protein